MNNDRQDYSTLANTRLIIQVAEYYSSTQSNLETYQGMNIPSLEALSSKHLLHWKSKLRHLILNGINCSDKEVA